MTEGPDLNIPVCLFGPQAFHVVMIAVDPLPERRPESPTFSWPRNVAKLPRKSDTMGPTPIKILF